MGVKLTSLTLLFSVKKVQISSEFSITHSVAPRYVLVSNDKKDTPKYKTPYS